MLKLPKSSKPTASTQPNSVSACIAETKSLCPVCLNRIDAQYRVSGDTVLLTKTCAEHGTFETPVWEGVEHFLSWREQQNPAQAPVNPARKAERGCPYDCGLCENHRQASCCVLLELTRRCDLHCPVCFASSDSTTAGDDPPLETIARWYDRILDQGGPFNIQLSGGEPTMRDDLPEIIRMGKERGFSFFQLNTNGLRIARDPEYLPALAKAGLNTVFLQFDSLTAEACVALRGRSIVAEKKQAIKNCAGAGLGVVLTPTVRRGVNEGEIGAIIDFAAANLPTVRGVHFQPMSFFGRYAGDPVTDRITLSALLTLMEEQSGGRIKAADFLPGGAEHPQCSFHAKYRVRGGNWELRKSPGNSGCCGGSSEGGSTTSDTARRTVARQWSAVKSMAPPKAMPGFNLDSLDKFVTMAEQQEKETIEISGMAFQDAWTVDLQRLSRCYINIVSPEGLLVPFCSYNLTAAGGRPLHRRKV
ncbi:radical SAM protein [Spirochaetia bacterium]|nr:radical SAM protein [Spirochaetia bacterium]